MRSHIVFRYHHSAFIRDNQLIIFGGWGEGDKTFFNDLYTINIDTWVSQKIETFGKFQPSPRCQAVPFRYENFLFFVGGAARQETTSINYGDIVIDCEDFWVLDIDTWVWTKTRNFNHPCSVYSVNEMGDGKFLLTGGMHSNSGEDMPHFHNHATTIHIQICK